MKLTLEGDAAEILSVLAGKPTEQITVAQNDCTVSAAEFLSRLAELYKTAAEDDPHDVQS